MKISKYTLKQIIKEEIKKVVRALKEDDYDDFDSDDGFGDGDDGFGGYDEFDDDTVQSKLVKMSCQNNQNGAKIRADIVAKAKAGDASYQQIIAKSQKLCPKLWRRKF